jgi:hypothetical protein
MDYGSTAAAGGYGAGGSASVSGGFGGGSDPSLAPEQLVPPTLLHSSIPPLPIPSAVDAGKQPPAPPYQSILQTTNSKGEPQPPIVVKKRLRVTDGVRQQLRKKKRAPGFPLDQSTSMAAVHGTRELPDRIEMTLPESGLMHQLLAMERKLDAEIARKQVDIQMGITKNKQVRKRERQETAQPLVALCPVSALFPLTIPLRCSHSSLFSLAPQSRQILRLFLWHESFAASGRDVDDNDSVPGGSLAPNPEQSCWLFKIQGQILEAEEPAPAYAPPTRCLTNYVQSLIVEIDPATPTAVAAAARSGAAAISSASSAPALIRGGSQARAPQTEIIEWRKHAAPALGDGFEIRRRAAAPLYRLKLTILLDHAPARFRLSPILARALGFSLYAPNPLQNHSSPLAPNPFPLLETQSAVLAAFWEYVNKYSLQDGASIRCDAALSQLFGVQSLPQENVLAALSLHMTPAAAEPIVIPYDIVVGSGGSGPAPKLGGSAGAPTLGGESRFVSPVTCYDILTYSPLVTDITTAHKKQSA